MRALVFAVLAVAVAIMELGQSDNRWAVSFVFNLTWAVLFVAACVSLP